MKVQMRILIVDEVAESREAAVAKLAEHILEVHAKCETALEALCKIRDVDMILIGQTTAAGLALAISARMHGVKLIGLVASNPRKIAEGGRPLERLDWDVWPISRSDHRIGLFDSLDCWLPDPCPGCGGKGEVWSRCDACSGVGTWTTHIDMRGTGFSPIDEKHSCRTCKGHGKTNASCPNCHGLGRTEKDWRKIVESLAGIMRIVRE